MLKLPVFAQWAGAEAVLMEQVPAFATHDSGKSAQAWNQLWELCGFQLHSETFEAQDLLPVSRSRLMLWAWEHAPGAAHRKGGTCQPNLHCRPVPFQQRLPLAWFE